jgi:phospholipid/cholesterol/gamma-HCH transport system permease protein
MMGRMSLVAVWQVPLERIGGAVLASFKRGAHALFFAALVLVLALSPSSYGRAQRASLARHLYLGTVPNLAWFTVLTTIVCVVVIRIVLVSTLSYGLTQYALELMIRLLVLELMPLAAAIYVALRCTMPFGEQVAHLRDPGVKALRQEVLPRVLAGLFAMVALVAASGSAALALIYLTIHGFSGAGLDAYTRLIGQVFEPSVTLVFTLKTLSLCVVVALVPMASSHFQMQGGASAATSLLPLDRAAAVAAGRSTSEELQEMALLFTLVLAIEIVSLVANYY